MFQAGEADKSDRLMKTVVRKNPNYAGNELCRLSWLNLKPQPAKILPGVPSFESLGRSLPQQKSVLESVAKFGQRPKATAQSVADSLVEEWGRYTMT